MKKEDFLRIAGLFEELDELEMALREIRQAPEFRLTYTTGSNRPVERILRPQITIILVSGLENILTREISRTRSALRDYGVEFEDGAVA